MSLNSLADAGKLGVLVFHEEMTASRWIGFAIIWVALVVMSYDAIRTARDPNWRPTPVQRRVMELEEEPDFTG